MSRFENLKAPKLHVILREYDTNEYTKVDITDITGKSRFTEDIKQQDSYEYKGIVLAVGPGLEDQIEVGDIVHHGLHSGMNFAIDKEVLRTINEHQICAIEKQPKK